MQFISSDTSVWIDFAVIHRIQLPFRLPYTYIMSKDAIEDEILSPPGLGEELKSCGLVPVNISIEEFLLAQQYGFRYTRLSKYDRIALAIAKTRKIILLTGDGALRKAASQEEVNIIGTLGILDRLRSEGMIEDEELRYCLEQLNAKNGGMVRLPKAEIDKRLNALSKRVTSV